jgi:hypothetical protein
MPRLKVLATLAALAMLAVPTARAEQPHPFAGHRQVAVMSQNLYLGTDLNPSSPPQTRSRSSRPLGGLGAGAGE